jgi:hypothetical protein
MPWSRGLQSIPRDANAADYLSVVPARVAQRGVNPVYKFGVRERRHVRKQLAALLPGMFKRHEGYSLELLKLPKPGPHSEGYFPSKSIVRGEDGSRESSLRKKAAS